MSGDLFVSHNNTIQQIPIAVGIPVAVGARSIAARFHDDAIPS